MKKCLNYAHTQLKVHGKNDIVNSIEINNMTHTLKLQHNA